MKYIIEQTPNVKYHIYADDIQIYAESCHHNKFVFNKCANNIRKWILDNNILINSSKTMLLNISLSNFVFPDIIFDNLLITLSSKIKLLGILFRVIYRSQIMYHIYVNQLIINYII